MSNSIVSEGKTTNEAIEKGLQQLKVTRDKVDIKVLENPDKRSFFSILTPRVVKVELTIKEESKNIKKEIKTENIKNREYDKNIQELEQARQEIENFLKEFLIKVSEELTYKVTIEEYTVIVDIRGNTAGILIGYRGDTLNAFQTILSAIANKKASEKVKLILDIENYREKRQKSLEELAEKVSKTVLRTGKSVTLEPMSAYERKIIHSKLQDNTKIQTYSIGENENRRVVIEKVKS
ncbi:MAG: RNA-binding cell elongation regulator Jag/EloR [Clostridia bacterium]